MQSYQTSNVRLQVWCATKISRIHAGAIQGKANVWIVSAPARVAPPYVSIFARRSFCYGLRLCCTRPKLLNGDQGHIVHCTLHTQWCECICALRTVRCTLNTVRCTLHTVHCTIHGPCGSNPPASVGPGPVRNGGGGSCTVRACILYMRSATFRTRHPKKKDGNARVGYSSLWKHAPPDGKMPLWNASSCRRPH